MRIYTLFRKVPKKDGNGFMQLPFQVEVMSDTEALFKGKIRYPNLEVTLSRYTEH